MIARYIGLLTLALAGTGLQAQQSSVRPSALLHTGPPHGHGAQSGTAPVNDQCNLVTPEALAAGSSLTFTGTTTGATISGDYTDGSILFGFGIPVVWVAFTTTEQLDVTVDYCGSASLFTDYWNILSTDCPATDALVISPAYDDTACVDNNPTVYFNALPAGTYYYPVWSDATTANGPYEIHVTAAMTGPTGPANDLCADAPNVVLDPGTDQHLGGDNTGATDTEGLGYATVWESFTLNACATVLLDYCGTSGFGSYAEGLMTDCTDGTLVSPTATTTCAEGQLQERFDQLPAGTYYIPVRMEAGVSEGAYNIALSATACPVVEPPANDLCGDVTADAFVVGEVLTFTGDTRGATADHDGVPGGHFEGIPFVWHAFTTTECTDLVLDYCNTPVPFGTALGVLAITCPADEAIAADGVMAPCADGNPVFAFENLPAGTYYIPVYAGPDAQGTYEIHVSGSACHAPPDNDECDGAMPLTVGVECDNISATVEGATGSMPAVDCNGNGVDGNEDVWFSFMATQPGQQVHVSGSQVDAVVEVFENACGDLAPIMCSDTSGLGGAEDFTLTGLTPTVTYYIRVYNWTALNPLDPKFDICVFGDVGTGLTERPEAAFSIFPNPGNGDLMLTHNGVTGTFQVEVLDMTGRTVVSEQMSLVHGQQHGFQWSGHLAQGSYSLRLTGAGAATQQRFMVK